MSTHQQELSLEALQAKIGRYHAQENAELVAKAWAFAERVHADQRRKSGEPYIIHPQQVAFILADLMLDAPTIAAGLLHDCVEDCDDVSIEMIQHEFGAEVAQLVDGVTKLTRMDFTTKEEQQAESLRKMIIAMSKDIRVVIIKLADRLHNMQTLKFQPRERQIAIAKETLDIYAPLAHRLGVFRIKQELEDLALRYIDPEGYQELAEKVGMKRAEREASIQVVTDQLRQRIEELGIHYDMAGRPKHFYSIYKKMVLQHKTFEQIYDLIAIRVLVDSIPDCYAVLGIVHTLWKQVPNRFKDYISTPKANMYQSLHTTVVGQNGMTFEVQIRTFEMHRIAEYGIAAHWRYKEGKQSGDELDKKLYWLRQILDWQDEARDSKEFIDLLKVDLFSEEVFVFTPKGDIIDLPRGATPLDFAYRIHSAIGNKCVGAKINGRIVTLDTELNTGDFVEVLTNSSSKGPSRDWLKIVKTTQAKAKIRQWFKKENREENVEMGHTMLEREAQRNGVQLSALTKAEFLEPLLKKYAFLDLEDLCLAVGYGAVSAVHAISRLLEEQRKREKPATPVLELTDPETQEAANKERQKLASSRGVMVLGEAGMLVRFARCCNPVPGDEIIGYITRGRGVTVHKADCINALHSEAERKVEVAWDSSTTTDYYADIQIVAYDHDGLLGELGALTSSMDVPIEAVSARIHKNATCTITMTVKIGNKQQLEKMMRSLQKRSDVLEVFRVTT